MILKVTSGFVYDKRKERWKLVEEGCQVEGEPILELASFLLAGEEYINSKVMRTRSFEMGGRTGQHHAERMLADASVIPVEYRQFFLVFPDTLWQEPNGGLYVPTLEWSGRRWGLEFHWLGREHCGDGSRIVRLRK